jgi:hypothetical protein
MGFARDDAKSAPKSAAHQCVDVSRLNTRMVLKPDTLLIEDTGGHAAILTMSAPCAQMDELDQIGFEINGVSRLCSRTDIKILHARFGGPQVRCIISDVKFLSHDEAKALINSQ